MQDIPNLIIFNNTDVSYSDIVNTYKLTTKGSSEFSPTKRHPPKCFDMFEEYGDAPEDAWRNFLFICGQHPWQAIVNTDDLQNKFHFMKKLLSFGSNYVYVNLILITKDDICKLVYDKNPQTKEETINLLQKEIAFKQECSNYVFNKIEDYPDIDHYDLDRYQEIVNTYNEIK